MVRGFALITRGTSELELLVVASSDGLRFPGQGVVSATVDDFWDALAKVCAIEMTDDLNRPLLSALRAGRMETHACLTGTMHVLVVHLERTSALRASDGVVPFFVSADDDAYAMLEHGDVARRILGASVWRPSRPVLLLLSALFVVFACVAWYM